MSCFNMEIATTAFCSSALLLLLSTATLGAQLGNGDIRTCEHDTYYPFPGNCQKYYLCVHDNLVQLECPNGLYFDFVLKRCENKDSVECHVDTTTTIRTTTTTAASCEHGERYPDPADCQNYFICVFNELIPQRCADGFYYDEGRKACYYMDEVDCSGRWTPSTTPQPPCEDGRSYPDPSHCQNYFICVFGMMYPATCPDGLYFDVDVERCRLQAEVDCSGRWTPGPTVETTTEQDMETSPTPIGFCSLHPCGIYPHPFYAFRFYICPNDFKYETLSYSCTSGNVYSSRARACVPDQFCSFVEGGCGMYPHPMADDQFYLCGANNYEALFDCKRGNIFNSTRMDCHTRLPKP